MLEAGVRLGQGGGAACQPSPFRLREKQSWCRGVAFSPPWSTLALGGPVKIVAMVGVRMGYPHT